MNTDSSSIATPRNTRNRTMNTARNVNAAALILSVVMTFGVFASVTSLAVPAHHGAVLVQAEQAPRS
jgi:hypothetical protein